MKRFARAVAVALITMLGAAPVRAQGNGVLTRMFAEGTLLGDTDRTLDDGTKETTKGVGFRAGFSLNERYSLRFEADVPERHIFDYSQYYQIAHIEQRTRSYALLFARDVKLQGPFHLSFLAGLARTDRETASSGAFVQVTSTGTRTIPYPDSDTHFVRASPEVGVDGAVDIGPHLSIVPSIRVLIAKKIDFPALITRPAVGVRVRF